MTVTSTPVPAPTTTLTVDEIRLGDPDTFLRDDVDGIFKLLRDERPVGFDEERTPAGLPPGPGFWSLVRHGDIVQVSRDHDTFSNVKAVGIFDYPVRSSIINMDPPVHTRFRLIVNRGFTPRMIGRLKDDVWAQAERIVDDIATTGTADLVDEISAVLPGLVIARMLGVPFEDQPAIRRLTNAFIAPADPEYGGSIEEMNAASEALEDYARRLGERRRDDPTDDVTSAIMHAEVPGPDGRPERISTADFAEFVKLLLIGGNETTRNAITHGVVLFDRHPDQKDRFVADPDGLGHQAADEILRYTAPVTLMRRTALHATHVAGVDVAEGDKVVMWYRAANFDDAVFDDPYRFDITRSPNDHFSFGAGGPHFCLGASLARLEISAMLATIYRRLPDVRVTGEPVRMRAISSHAIKHLPVAWTPPR